MQTLVAPNLYLLLSLTENIHSISKNILFLYVCILCFHVSAHECFHLISNVHIVRTFENRIPFQTFEKWLNVSHRYVSYIKSETFFTWRTGAWFLKPFEERVEKNHIYHIVKPNSTEKTGPVYRECNVCYEFFWKMEKLTLIAKFKTLT